jgi:hypothetical protein
VDKHLNSCLNVGKYPQTNPISSCLVSRFPYRFCLFFSAQPRILPLQITLSVDGQVSAIYTLPLHSRLLSRVTGPDCHERCPYGEVQVTGGKGGCQNGETDLHLPLTLLFLKFLVHYLGQDCHDGEKFLCCPPNVIDPQRCKSCL